MFVDFTFWSFHRKAAFLGFSRFYCSFVLFHGYCIFVLFHGFLKFEKAHNDKKKD